VVKANLDAGHLGTYFAPNGGKFGRVGVAFFKAVLMDDKESRAKFGPNGTFVAEKWAIESKNWL
jgi:hypothetical protein